MSSFRIIPVLLSGVVACMAPPSAKGDEIVRPSPASIYQLESTWRDKTGHKRKLADLAGQVRVLAMGFTSCQYACPRILADMRAIERALSKDAAAKVGFTFVSFDPATDTPARLKEFQSKNKHESWLFLTGDEDGALELGVALGIKIQKVPEVGFAHSNVIFVLAPDGAILHRQESLGADPAGSVSAVKKALASAPESKPR
jgi:protein SCO1/2